LQAANLMEPETTLEIERDCVSLENLLDNSCPFEGLYTKLSRDECLPLAVTIASSLLQLHATPWLPADLCSRSIYFTRFHNDHNPIDVRYPYVTRKIGEITATPPTRVTLGFHPNLVALGIILLELSEKRTISSWYEQTFAESLPSDVQGKAKAAWIWFEEDASERMSLHYQAAIKHCLNAHFLGSFPLKRMTLADDGFREAVYRHIILHLEKSYEEHKAPITDVTLQSF
jgi:hypothetical protein